MAATTAGVLKARIESLGLSVTVYRDAAPRRPDNSDPPLPYVTIREEVALVPDLDGTFDDAVTHTVAETVLVDLWQRWRNPDTGKVAESYSLPHALADALHGVGGWPSAGSRRIHGTRLVSRVRLLEHEENVVHHAFTIVVHREQ